MKNKSKLSKFVILCISVLIIFTITELVVSCVTSYSHDTLTTCVFGTFGGEMLMCCVIKVFNIKKGE